MAFVFHEARDFDYDGYFARVVSFLSSHRWIFECSNTRFIKESVLTRFPTEWIDDFLQTTNEELNQIPLGYINEQWSQSFKSFLSELINLQVNYERLKVDPAKATNNRGISRKKRYEIDQLTGFLGTVCDGTETVLDFGAGLGYVSQTVHEVHRLNVLAVDGNESFVEKCYPRQRTHHRNTEEQVRFVHHYITESSFPFLRGMVQRYFPTAGHLAIIGLHACADLSVTALHLFVRHDAIRKLAIMPCCYHKLQPTDERCTTFHNIPLSDALRRHLPDGRLISRPFLRLGCQQTATRWKVMTAEDHRQHGRTMFHRALVDAILEDGELVRVRRASPGDDCDGILAGYQLSRDGDIPWRETHRVALCKLQQQYANGHLLAEYLTCLQTCLQPLCENIILLDRMCHLEAEANGVGLKLQRRLVKLDNDNLSPRCFIFYANKVS